MQDPWDNGLVKWKLQNIDDAHFYQMSYPEKDVKPGIFQKVSQFINRQWIVFRCRLAALSISPNLMIDQQCDCIES